MTRREREVLGLLAEGCSNREIGERLVISEKTASIHVSNILGKLSVSSRTEAVVAAISAGMVAAVRPRPPGIGERRATDGPRTR